MRLGLFVDAVYRSDGERVWSGNELLGFSNFAAAVGANFERMLVISRATEDPGQAPFELPPGIEHFALPFYPSLRRLPAVVAAIPATVRALWRSLDEVDMVWVSAANPVALLLAGLARLRGKRVAVLVRQETMVYYRNRLPSRAWTPLLAPLWVVERLFKRLGRGHPVTAVGESIARAYGAPRPNVIEFEVNLIPTSEIPEAPDEERWGSPASLLTVGRIEPEKDPELLVETVSRLERAGAGRFTVTWAGDGRLRAELEGRAREAGLGEALRVPGFVPFGPALSALYREADAYVHVAKTEGVPGVICEAMAFGLPIVATDVGGIRAATGDGAAALLVEPGDAEGMAAAIERLAAEPELRRRLASEGLALARRSALDVESRRVAEFLMSGP